MRRTVWIAIACLGPAHAMAASFEIDIACPSSTVEAGADQVCTISYTNPTGAALSGVTFELVFFTITATGIATDLPDGMGGT